MQVKSLAGVALVALLAFGPVHQAFAAGRVLLVEAVKQRNVTTVRTLLKQQPASVNAAEPDGTTALHVATDQDDLATVELLVRAGANVKATNRYGVTPLYS